MLQSTVVLFVVALVAGTLGFADVAATLSNVANVMLFTFVVVFVTRELLERTRNEDAPPPARPGRDARQAVLPAAPSLASTAMPATSMAARRR